MKRFSNFYTLSVVMACAAMLLLIPVVTSCGGSRRVAGTENIAGADAMQRFDALVSGYEGWHDLTVPVKLQLGSL